MVVRVFETARHFSPPPSDGGSITPHKPIALSFERPRTIHQPTITSQPKNTNTHLRILDKPIYSTTYASILDSCTCPNLGNQLHAHTIKSGFHGHEFVQTKLLQMYCRCGCVNNAGLLFDAMPLRNLYSWAAILNVHLDLGLFDDAVSIFQQFLFEDIGLDFFLFPVMLKVCSRIGMVELGEQLHAMAIKYLFVSNIYVGNALIDMYGKCGYLGDAKKVLQNMHERDCVSWNSMLTACAANGMVYEALEFLERMSLVDSFSPNLVSWSAVIGGFAQNGYDKEAIEMLARMQADGQKPNARTLASVLPACAKLQKLDTGRELLGYITRHRFMSNSFVVNGLIDVYRRCGDMRSAFKIFSRFSVKNTISYNTMIVGYCKNGETSKAREFFYQMAVAGIKKDIISWNSMISGYVDNFMFEEALSMFSDLLMGEELESDSFTLGSVLTACADMASLRRGKEAHSYAIAKGLHCNSFVGGALVEMYCKCGDLEAAQTAFDEITENDTATWNALVSGYARCNRIESIQDLLQKMKRDGCEPNVYTWNGIIAGHVENGHHDMAMQLFSEMQASELKPDIYTIGIILPSCSRLITLERGKQIHAFSVRCGYDSDVHIGAALVDMYSKCGSIKYGSFAYNRIANPNLVSQNAMLTAYATHGLGDEGVDFFRRMLATGVRPDHVTFLSVLSACVHAGSVETGHEFFDLMGYYGLKPTLKHYTCMVDLLSRAGQLHEAYEFIKTMPVEPDLVLWGALLGGCVIHGNVGLGEIAAKRLIELGPSDSGNYVLLANLYAFAGRWSDLARTRQLMKDGGIQKSPGCSWIEEKEEIHAFLASDRGHMRTDEIYATLDTLNLHMKRKEIL